LGRDLLVKVGFANKLLQNSATGFSFAKFTGGGPGGRPRNQVSVQSVFTDRRTNQVLRQEAEQLPNDGPGLIMVDIGHSGDFETWSSLISRQLQPRIRRGRVSSVSKHSKVSGVCLFSAYFADSEGRRDFVVNAQLLNNPLATHPLPSWIAEIVPENQGRIHK
jgi:hypothetical protein